MQKIQLRKIALINILRGSGSLVLTDYELQKLKDAYKKTMSAKEGEELDQKEYELYGSYDPLTVTITHILNNKSGISFTSYSHTGLPVAVFAKGVGQENFEGYFDNTEIYKNSNSDRGKIINAKKIYSVVS